MTMVPTSSARSVLRGAGSGTETDGVVDQSELSGPPPAAARYHRPLVVEDLSVTFRSGTRQVTAVRGVSFTVLPGRTLVLLGESGSGKSVSARAVLGLHGAAARVGGRIRLGELDLLGLEEREMRGLRGRTVALVPQDATGALDPLRRVGSQVVEILRCHGLCGSRKEAGLRAEELLRQVGIPDPGRAARSYPHELSGGMRQRALIAMGVACGPEILIADEPTTALDVTIQAQVLELFAQLQEELGMGLLLVTHDVGVARDVADHVAVMYAGRLVEEGPGRAVLDDPRHPYTAGLLGAVPTPATARGGLAAIPGQPPVPGQVPAGCAFAPRCADALPSCATEEPTLVSVGAGRRVACPVRVPAVVDLRSLEEVS